MRIEQFGLAHCNLQEGTTDSDALVFAETLESLQREFPQLDGHALESLVCKTMAWNSASLSLSSKTFSNAL